MPRAHRLPPPCARFANSPVGCDLASTPSTAALWAATWRGLDLEAAIDLNAMVRQDQLPPLDLGPYRVGDPGPVWANYLPQSRVRSQASSAQSLAMNNDWLLPVRHSSEQSGSTSEPRLPARNGYANKLHATRQLGWRIRTTSHATTTASPKSLLACENGTGRVSSTYLELALSMTLLPEDVPHQTELAYSPREEQAVVRFELPSVEVIPTVESNTYVTTTGSIREKKRPAAAQVAQLYRFVVSQITLLHMRDLFESDPELNTVELGGHVHFANPATGQPEYQCLISIAVDRAKSMGSTCVTCNQTSVSAI